MRFRVAALLLGPLLIAACQLGPASQAPRPTPSTAGRALRVTLTEAPRSFDPALQYLVSEREVGRLYVEPLLRPAPDLSDVEAAAAESYDVSPDGLIYTFHLRPNGKYADGRAVVAADFVFAWRRLVDPRLAAPHAALFAASIAGGVEAEALDPKYDALRIEPALNALGLKALDQHTFQVTLPEPQGYFKWIATLWNGAPLRQEVVQAEGGGWASKPEALVTNGPYQVTGMGSFASLAANPHYWGGPPPTSEVIAAVSGNAADALRRYRDGRLEMTGVPPSLADEVAGDATLTGQLVKTARLTQHWIDFNTQKAPFDNPKVRQAFAQAIDRAQYIKDVWRGVAQPATALVPAGMPGHPDRPAPFQSFDAGAAKGFLAASGEPAAQFDGIELLVEDSPFARAAAEGIRAQLRANLGLALTVKPLTAPQLETRLHHGDFQVAGPLEWTADYPDPQDWLDLFRTADGRNYPHWRNQHYDLLVELGDRTQDQTKRLQAYNQAQQVLLADPPLALLDQVQQWALVKPYVKGVQPSAYDAGPFPGNLEASRITIARS